MSSTIRGLILADLHSGHNEGLTHVDFDERPNNVESWHYKKYISRRKHWDFYKKTVESSAPYHFIAICGDGATGKEKKTAGRELLLPDTAEQVENAVACIEIGVKPGFTKIWGVTGTPYHSGDEQNLDWQIIHALNGDFHDHAHKVIRDVIFDIRHHIGAGNGVTTTPANALKKEELSNLLWAEFGEYPRANVILRGHAHRFFAMHEPSKFAFILPALATGSIFGRIRCSNVIHFGLMTVEFTGIDDFSYTPHILRTKHRDHFDKIEWPEQSCEVEE